MTVWLAVAAGLISAGGPAAAHAGGLTATDAQGTVVSVSPAVPGLTVEAIENGARLRLHNATATPVTVSPGGGTATPAVAAPGTTLTWMDTRCTPDGRSVAPGAVVPWTITLTAGGTPVTVTGVLTGGRPPLSPLWWAAVLAVAAAVVLLARRSRAATGSARRLAKRGDLLLAACGTVAAVASIGHVAGSTLAVESAPMAGTFLSAAGINLLAWPLILGGAWTTLRGRAAGVLAVCAGAALTAVFVLPDVTAFHRAVLPFAGAANVERALVVVALGLGTGVAVAGAGVLRDLAARQSTSPGPS
ncbi:MULTISPECIES: hypothetical protein [Actinoplanes]|uniref:hypothetical protein n=1 Tax=Actinoplanes TaxID=1865 RepID=UPI001FDFDD0C|nr:MULTISPECIES: hypothetical protein [Actinoplanes]GLY06475.1 hypothetical protein Acsp01_68540 [Actinoplanes sp. NBRC 101535]